jgi:hypothetical protein
MLKLPGMIRESDLKLFRMMKFVNYYVVANKIFILGICFPSRYKAVHMKHDESLS